jgi:hypothetical protein
MTPQLRIRRLGWIAALALCTALYLLLHFKVHAVQSDVIRAERKIVRLEQEKILLETEFETRANLLQLSSWNQVDFGYTAPVAGRAPGAPDPIRVAHSGGTGETPQFPQLVSPLTGKPIDEALLDPARQQLNVEAERGPSRIQLGAIIGSARE